MAVDRPDMEGPSYSEMREQNLYTDAVVKSASGRQWNVHKVVMSRLGRFICNAFSFPTFDGTLNLALGDEVVQIIIDLAYEGTCHINTEIVFDALAAALVYQLGGLITGCVTFVLNEMISSKHIIALKIFIGIHQAELEVTTDGALMDVVDKWFRKNFIDIYEDREMLKLSFEQMEHIANCDDLNIPEEEFLRFLLKYVTSKGLDREKTIQLLATVRQRWINPSKLSSILQENQHLQEEIEESKDVKNHPNPRYPRDLVIVFESRYDHRNFYAEVFNIRKNEWTRVEPSDPATDPFSRNASDPFSRNCVSSGNIIYIIYELGIGKAVDIRDGRCYEVEKLPLPNDVGIGGFHVVAWNGGLIAFLDSIVARFYDPKENQWSPFPTEEIGGFDATRVVVNGTLFSIGGDDHIRQWINSIEYYDAESNTWILCGNLKRIVGLNKAAVVDDKVYVFPDGSMSGETDGEQPDVECFKPVYENGRMSLIWFPPIQTPWRGRRGFQASVVDNKILITGNEDADWPISAKDCHLFCPRTGEWSRVADLWTEKTYHKAVTVNTSELEVDRIQELCSERLLVPLDDHV